jgi:ribosomal protein S18 acetylase RimI-like enzyme
VLYRAVEENLRVAMRCYARVSERGEARDYPGLSVASCGLNCAVFNSAMLSRPVEQRDFVQAVTLADVHFRQRGLGWTFWLCRDLVPAPLQKEATLMFRNSGMEFRAVIDETTRLNFAYLSSVIFSLPFDTSQKIYGSSTLWNGPMTGWVAYLNGRPVCIVTVVIGGGVLGVYSVGTLPEYQRRGFAETAMRYALARASEATGLHVSVLQSTAQGMNLYARMGYRVVTRFGVYLNEGNGSH